MKYDIVRHGDEQQPVVIIEDFSSQFAAIVEAAKNASYNKAMAAYPGIRAGLNAQYLSERSAILSEIVQNIFGFTRGIKCESCDYSIVTTKPEDLTPGQQIPHYDTPQNNILAFMHYVHSNERGGTAFYRHKKTGFETITAERENQYRQALKAEDENKSMPEPAYIYGSNDRFEMIGDIESKPNRFILYRGQTLHSGSISKDANFSPDPSVGRLTINGFLLDS